MWRKYLSNNIHVGFLASSSIIFAGSFVVNVLNYVFTLLISRILGVAAFGEITTLFSLLLIVSVPASALTMLMTREAAMRSAGEEDVADIFVAVKNVVVRIALVFWVVFLLAIPLISSYLLISWPLLALFSLSLPITFFGALQSGTLQGLQEFLKLAKQNVLNALTKLGTSLIFVYAGFSVAGVMLGLLCAQIVSLVYGHCATSLFSREAKNPFSLWSLRPVFLTILATTFLLALLSNIDILLAKHFLTQNLAGQYAALSTVGKILIYGIGAFITVLLPMVASAHASEKEKGAPQTSGKGILALSLLIISAASLCIYLIFLLRGPLVVSILFGERYLMIAPYLATFSIAMACISLSTALVNYFIAIGNSSCILMLGLGILFEVVMIYFSHDSLASLTYALLVSSAVLLGLLAANFVLVTMRTRAV